MSTASKWWALIGLSFASAFIFIELVMVSTILASIQSHLMASYTQLQWILNVYTLLMSVFMITMGRFGDIFGNRFIALMGMAGFGISSFFVGLSQHPEWMIGARAFQGFFGALILPCSIALVNQMFSDEKKGRIIGIWNAIVLLGVAFAPLLATILKEFYSWRWVFFIAVPFMLVCMIIVLFSLRQEPQTHEKQPIDWWGLVFLTIGTSTIVTAFTQGFIWGWTSPSTLILLIAGVIATVLWTIVEMTEKTPIVNFSWFANKTFASSVTTGIIATSVGIILLFLIPLYMHNVMNYSYNKIGIYLLSLTVPGSLISPLAGWLADRWSHRVPIICGSLFLLASVMMCSFLGLKTPLWFLLLALFLFGLSWGLIIGPTKTGVLNSLPHRKAGAGMGALLSFEHLGATVFLAIMGTIFRHSEYLYLNDRLRQEGVLLSQGDAVLIESLTSHPLKVRAFIHEIAPSLQGKVLPLFKNAFVYGFDLTMWTLFWVALACSCLFLFLKTRSK